jgi:TonB family protein
MKGFTRIRVLLLIALSGCYPTHKPSFPKFEPTRPPGSATAQPKRNPSSAPEAPSWSSLEPCLKLPETQAYLASIRDSVASQWRVSSPASGVARIRFVLGSDGQLESFSLTEESHPGVGETALQALTAAEPFGPVPAEARCLVGIPFTSSFTIEGTPE